MKICFLINPAAPGDNAQYLTRAAKNLGHETQWAAADGLSCHEGSVMSEGKSLETFDLVWIVSLGNRRSFLDKIQLLKLLSQKTRVVNTPDAMVYLHSKISMCALPPPLMHPETHVSSSLDELWDIYAKSDSAWILKPVADMLGRQVFLLDRGNTSARPLLEAMTEKGNYCLLQRYVPEIKNGEKRVLVAGGEIIGQYVRKASKDHRTNLHQGARAELCDLTKEERAACTQVAAYLLSQGVTFAGLDLTWPYLLEWNVMSPGGLSTIDKLGGGNWAEKVVEKVTRA